MEAVGAYNTDLEELGYKCVEHLTVFAAACDEDVMPLTARVGSEQLSRGGDRDICLGVTCPSHRRSY